MIPIHPVGGHAFPAELNPRIGLLASLESFRRELIRCPLDPLNEQLEIWHRDFVAALNARGNIELTMTRYVDILFNHIQVPVGEYPMLRPIVEFLQRNHVPIPQQFVPQQFERPSPEQVRAARIEALRALQQEYRPASPPPPPPPPPEAPALNPILAGRIVELEQGLQDFNQRVAAFDARVIANVDVLDQRVERLEIQAIPAVEERVDLLQENQRAAGQDIVYTQEELRQVEEAVANTKKALEDERKRKKRRKIITNVAVTTLIVVINIHLPGSTTATWDGMWARVFYRP